MFDRRSMLRGIGGVGMMTMAGCVGTRTDDQPFFSRIGLPIALQVYTLGEEAGRDLDATFAQLAGIGYRELELPNLYGRPAIEVAASAKRAGLTISSLHLAVSTRGAAAGLSLTSPPAEIADALGALGAKRVVMPIALFPENFRPDPSGNMAAAIGQAFAAAGEDPWRRTAAVLNQAAAALRPLGIGVGYHNHNVEFAPIGDTNGWEILLRELDPTLVSFEIDTGWIATAGLDPVAFLGRHRGRVTQLHVKDVAPGNTINYALQMKPAEVGTGTLDWARILPAAYDAGVRHFYVEQEPPFAIPRMEAARRSHAYLSELQV